MKVHHKKKNSDSKGKPIHKAKDKHQIEKMPIELDADNLVQLRRDYSILP